MTPNEIRVARERLDELEDALTDALSGFRGWLDELDFEQYVEAVENTNPDD